MIQLFIRVQNYRAKAILQVWLYPVPHDLTSRMYETRYYTVLYVPIHLYILLMG